MYTVYLHLKQRPCASGPLLDQTPSTIRRRKLRLQTSCAAFFRCEDFQNSVLLLFKYRWCVKKKKVSTTKQRGRKISDVSEPSVWRFISQWNHRVRVIVVSLTHISVKLKFTSDMHIKSRHSQRLGPVLSKSDEFLAGWRAHGTRATKRWQADLHSSFRHTDIFSV